MRKVTLDMAMSLDGFIAGPNDESGGLHDYFFRLPVAPPRLLKRGSKLQGQIVMGRRTYNIGAKQDGFVDNPYQVPTFVLSPDVPKRVAKGAETFIFTKYESIR